LSYHVLFSFSSGLSKTIRVPRRTIAAIQAHVAEVEAALHLTTEQYLNNPPHWTRNDFSDIDDKVFCDTAREHNAWVCWLYRYLAAWSKTPPKPSEALTPKIAKTFWHALEPITVPVERWTRDYYIDRMKHLYVVMRAGEHNGVTFDSKKLTTEQARDVIVLFSEFLDPTDCRLDVPLGTDELAASDDGGYEWCEKCGAVLYEDAQDCRKRGCPIRKELA